MESTIVIKVNHGKTLRRFNAHVDEAGKLKLSLDGLREKVLSLFSLSPDVDLTLTYRDEDGDSVTLADDDDLSDVMSQSLDPLRITAEVNTEKSNSISSSARSSGNSTPMRSSPKVSQPLPDLNKTFSEIFKAVPEPIGEAISKLSIDLASKAAASSPQLPELVHQFSKMLQSYGQNFSAGAESSTPSLITKEPVASLGGDIANPKIAPVPNFVDQPLLPKTHPTLGTPVNNSFVATEPAPMFGQLGGFKEQVEKSYESSLNREARKACLESVRAAKNLNFIGRSKQSLGQCSFPRMPVANGSFVPNNPFAPQLTPPLTPLRRNSHGGVGGVFHTGVCCDGCGVHPITGARFKSKVKEDYDLCNNCFAEMGSEAEYTRLDCPVPYQNHPLKGSLFGRVNSLVEPPTFPQALKSVVKPKHPKLDSRFIMDVNVADGTMMAPSTPFTKIWRMRNNGTLVWPQGTQLVWIGGDRLSISLSAEIQIPVDGLAVEDELEVSVDFKSPELPGRYISYWRMSTLSGQKFGQRVWVLIQVDASLKDSASNSSCQGLNLNFPPQNDDESVADNVASIIIDGLYPTLEPSNIINVDHTPVDGRVPIHDPFNKDNDLVEPLVVPIPIKDQDQDLDFPINDNLLVVGPTTVSYPIVDSSDVPPVEAYLAPPTAPAEAERWEEENSETEDGVEQILLKELEAMGFKQVDLNKEILRINEYNLEQSVDDLCGVYEWDPILEELQEMGFRDKEMNKRLLKKNNGSIKDVVLDLISGEKA